MSARSVRALRLAGLVVGLALAGSGLARAHERGLSRAELRVHGARISAELMFARPEIVGLVPGADADRNGQLDEVELLSVEASLSEQVLAGVQLSAGDAACPGAVEAIRFVEEDGLGVAVGFTCPAPVERFTVRLPLLARLAPGHRLLGRVVFQDMSSETSPHELDFVAHRRRNALTIRRPEPTELASAPAPAEVLVPSEVAAPPASRVWLALAAAPVGLALIFLLRRRRRA